MTHISFKIKTTKLHLQVGKFKDLILSCDKNLIKWQEWKIVSIRLTNLIINNLIFYEPDKKLLEFYKTNAEIMT